jgi:hypothetical protein
VEEAADGSLVAHYGYQSDNGLTVDIPYGRQNRFDRDTGHARPTEFWPGDNPFAFGVPLGAGQTHTWRLNPDGGPTTVVRADASSPRCDPTNPALLCGGYCNAALDAECADPGATYSRCMVDCIDNVFFFGYYFGCGEPFNAYVSCQAGLSSDAANWDCSVPGNPPTAMAPNCETEFLDVLACLGY